MSVLVTAKHVAGAAQFEVESGNAKSGAQFAKFFHGGEAFAGDVGKRGVRGHEKISVSALRGTADAAAELVEFGESEAIGAVDQDGVGAGDVETVLNDRSRNEDFGFIADEFYHHA